MTLWTVALQAPLSMEFSRQEYWSGFPCLPPGELSDPGFETISLACAALSGGFFTTTPPGKPLPFPPIHLTALKLRVTTLGIVGILHPVVRLGMHSA